MRGQLCVGDTHQRRIEAVLFLGKGIDGDGLYMPWKPGHEGCQLFLVNDAATSGINQDRALAHLAKRGTAEQALGERCERRVDGDDVGLTQKLLECLSSFKSKDLCSLFRETFLAGGDNLYTQYCGLASHL